MMKKKKWIFYVTFFVGLILVFWLALYLFTDTFNQSRLVNRSVVKPFTFYKEDGSLFTKADMAGKVCVVEFFFTTCPNICPEMNTNMKKVYEAFKDEPNFLILSHTCDPKRDSVPVLKKYADRERDYLPSYTPGSIYKVELDATHPLAFGYSDNYYTLKQNTAIYEFMKDGWNVGIVKKGNYVTGFSGYKVKDKLKDGTVVGVMEMGNGAVTIFADDPIFRLFWENGKLLFCNAVFLVGNQ